MEKERKIKNVIIVNDFDYVQGGASKVALDTAELLKNDYNVIYFSGTNESTNEDIEFVSTNQKEALKDNKVRGTINGLYNVKAKNSFSKLLDQYSNEDTIIHVHGWTKLLSSSIFVPAFKKRFKVVVTLHDYFTACPNGGFFNYPKNTICDLKPMSFKCFKCNCDSRNYAFKLYRLIRQDIQNSIIKNNLKYAIGISDLNIKVLKKLLPGTEIRKIINPIELELKYSYSKKNDYYLYLGRVTKEKGVDVFCKALSKMNKKAIVVGDGSELERLKKEYPNIMFTGWKNKEEVDKYLKGAKALILPSLWYEGAPLTPLEAMSYGVPCIISSVCSGREYITDNGFIFNPYKIGDLEEKINLLEEDIIKYSKNSFEYVKKYDKDNYVKELKKYYNKIIND